MKILLPIFQNKGLSGSAKKEGALQQDPIYVFPEMKLHGLALNTKIGGDRLW
jgi:hypothetical protein